MPETSLSSLQSHMPGPKSFIHGEPRQRWETNVARPRENDGGEVSPIWTTGHRSLHI